MRRRAYLFSSNPLVEAVSLLAAVVMAVIAFIFGAVLLALVVGLIAIGVLAFSVRLWWLRRKLGSAAARPANQPQVIEAEYTVIERTTRQDDQ